MNFSKHTIFLVVVCALLSSCSKFDGDQTVPAYISLDAIRVVDDPGNSWLPSQNEGFYSQLIDAVQIQLLPAGASSEEVLGTFQLPCTVPVLHQGALDRIRIVPVVKQNGIAATRIYYPFYREKVITGVSLTPADTTRLDTVETNYLSSSQMTVAMHEYFEPEQNGTRLSSAVEIVSHTQNPDVVVTDRCDHGCGRVHVEAGKSTLNFWALDSICIANSSSAVYLEMDYWSDFNFSVGFNNPMVQGGSNEIRSAMVLYANSGWQKIYINLGKLWSYYNYYHNGIRLYFTVLNSSGKEGNLYLDNMKVVVTQ